MLAKQYQGQGYGAMLISQFLNWVYETIGYHRINVRIDRSNERSILEFIPVEKENENG